MKFGGGKDTDIVKQSARNRKGIPPEIANAPTVSDSNVIAWRCFWDLRRGADELAALRWTDVLLWANAYSLCAGEMEALQDCIVVLDNVFLPFIRAKREAEAARARAEAARTTGRSR